MEREKTIWSQISNMIKMYKDDQRLMIMGLCRVQGLNVELYRYDPVLIGLYFSLPEDIGKGRRESWVYDVPDDMKQKMVDRVMDLEKSHGMLYSDTVVRMFLCCSYRETVPKGVMYRIDLEPGMNECMKRCDKDEVYEA